MTYQPAQPAEGNSVSAGGASDVKTFVAAALLPFSAGLLVLVGALLIGVFGGLLGVVAAIFGAIWWRSLNGKKMFPRDIAKGPMIGLSVASVLLVLLVVLMV
ncbi:hypothetical protein [Amycolatopsis magusensis]|uniref:hypothetical protein n=1 Tax=Amycolatopsis magusensis TaxID=882444 RepID=UPI003798C5AF